MCEVHAELFFHDNNFKCQVYRNEKNVYDDFDWCVMCIIWRCTRNIDHTQKKNSKRSSNYASAMNEDDKKKCMN